MAKLDQCWKGIKSCALHIPDRILLCNMSNLKHQHQQFDWAGLFWTLITEWNYLTNEIVGRMKLFDKWNCWTMKLLGELNYLTNEIIWRMKLLGEWSRIWLKPKLAKVRTETGCQGLAHIFKGADPSFSDQLKREKTPQLWTIHHICHFSLHMAHFWLQFFSTQKARKSRQNRFHGKTA